MFRFIPYILKTLWRHRSRTLLTVSGSAVALFVFCFVGAVQQGMNDLKTQQESQQALITFQIHKFCPATSHLPQDYQQTIAGISGVREVVPIQVFTNNCRASLDVVVFYGIPPKQLRRVRDFQLESGSWDEFEKHQDTAVMGKAVAERRGKKVGDNIKIGELAVNIAGIYSSDNPSEENYIYTHLDYLQRGKDSNKVGTVTQFEVLLEPGVDSSAKCSEIDAVLRNRQIETDTRPKGVFQAKSLGDLTQIIGMAHYLGYSCVALVLTLVATTTVMSVQDRIKEHAVLQTLGFTPTRVFCLVLSESVLLSIAGGVIGVGAAMLVLHFGGLAVGAEAVTIAFTPSIPVAAIGMAVATTAGFLAGLAPAWHAAHTQIVPALRQA
jgi:putative ABC transport system permease protein